MKKKLATALFFTFVCACAFAGNGEEKESTWYEITGTFVAMLAAILGIAVGLTQIMGARPSNQKLKLEIESLQLDVEEKKRKLKIKDTPEATLPEHRETASKPLYYEGLWNFSNYSIGYLAIFLPIILVSGSMLFGGMKTIPDSIGAYYYTNMRDIYVGTHLVIAVLLFSYMGYGRQDFLVSKIQGLFCLLIGFCPTGSSSNVILSTIHFTSFTFFVILQSFFSLFLFTKSGSQQSRKKKIRNSIYRTCGIILLVSLVFLLAYDLILSSVFPGLRKHSPGFYIESIVYWAFGMAWLVKGEFILKD